jgi:transcriptional regulator with XRE-family HTH domain
MNQAMCRTCTSASVSRTSLADGRGGPHFGETLRSVRERAGLTQEELGELIGYSRTAVSRMESSPDPRLSPRVLCRISEVLDTTTAVLLGQVVQEDPVNRRQLLQASASAAVTLATTPRSDPGRVGAHDVAEIEHGITDLRALDQRVGGDRLGYFAGRLVDEAERLLAGSYGSVTAARLHAVFGQACMLAGWLAQDAGNPDRATQLYTEAMAAAPLAQDPLLTAHACANLSLLTAMSRQPARAVQYAQAGQRAARQGRGGPRLRALLFARETSGYARMGDASATDEAMRRALTAFDSDHGSDPAWAAFLSDVELAGILGDAHTRLGQHGPALRQLTLAAQMQGLPRNAAIWRLILAEGHALAGDPAQAAALASASLPDVLDLSSTRVRTRVRTLGRVLAPHTKVSEVRAFHDQARAAGLAA